MLELGEYTKQLHEQVGKEVYENKIDIVMLSGEYAKYIENEAKKQGMKQENIYYFEKKESILEKLEEIVKPGDVILFKASNGMKIFELAEKLIK